MTETRLLIGADVRYTDGDLGRLQRIIVDPVHNRLTHLAVKPDEFQGGRLAPAGLIASAGVDILLRCTTAEFARLEPAEESSPQHTASWPYVSDERGGRFPAGVEGIERDTGYGNRTVTRDRIPDGGVEIRRGETLHATDGDAGRVQGLIIDLPETYLTHLLAGVGRLFGRRQIAVPIGSVTGFGDGIQLNLSQEQVRALPELAAHPKS
jgi:sporulation protein YlmC with PRC-barrel domain